MSDDESRVSRRSVLKTTGAALGVGVGATGTAAAACNKVRVKNDYYLLHECGGQGTPENPFVERGTELYVYETCDPSGDAVGPIYYRIECGDDLWIEDLHVECIAGTPPPCFEG